MPGLSIPGFLQRALDMARAGVYNLRIHHDRVLQPLLTAWNVEQLTGLTARAAEIQQKLMELPGRVLQQAERFEKRYAAT
jgi:acyl-[acyl-carrier-protein] desaturase